MCRKFHVVETTMRVVWIVGSDFLGAHSVFGKTQKWVKQWFEVCFADERSCVSGTTQVGGNTWRVFGKWHTVHPHAVSADMLAREHGAA